MQQRNLPAERYGIGSPVLLHPYGLSTENLLSPHRVGYPIATSHTNNLTFRIMKHLITSNDNTIDNYLYLQHCRENRIKLANDERTKTTLIYVKNAL